MAYSQHASVPISLEASRVISAIPTTEELLILMRGTHTLGGDNDGAWLRPNSDGTAANYGGAFIAGTDTGNPTGGGHTANGFFLSQGGNGHIHVATYRIAKVGDNWISAGHSGVRKLSTGADSQFINTSTWLGGGVAISTLQFRWDINTAAARFTGHVEVWYRVP